LIEGIKKVWLARHRVDFRCGHEGLLAQAKLVGLDLEPGQAILFVAKDKRKLKLLFSDENGLWVAYKKFYVSGLKIHLEFFDDPAKSKLLKRELEMLLSGASYIVGGKPAPWP